MIKLLTPTEEDWQLAYMVIDPFKTQWAIDSFDYLTSTSGERVPLRRRSLSLLWNLVANDLITTRKNNHDYAIGYADDIVILTSGMHAGTVSDITRLALAYWSAGAWRTNFQLTQSK